MGRYINRGPKEPTVTKLIICIFYVCIMIKDMATTFTSYYDSVTELTFNNSLGHYKSVLAWVLIICPI